MSFALISLTLMPRGPNGWSSPRLVFGEFLTLVRGGNGSGKTPVMEAIAYALGNPTDLPAEVRSRCSEVVLGIRSADGTECEVARTTDRQYPATIRLGNTGAATVFEDARAWSEWWLEFSGIPKRVLTSKSQQATHPYASTVLPFFWVDQDSGWNYLYSPHEDFILKQEEEITRLLLGLAPRRVFRNRDALAAAKQAVNSLEELVDARRATLDSLRRESGFTFTGSVESLEAERAVVVERLRSLESAADAVRTGAREFDAVLDDTRAKRSAALRRAAYASEQKRQLERAAAEISGEAELLSHNVVAQQTFRQFCGRDDCGLFADTEASSYGRRLLYLGDQLKDLRSYAAGLETDIATSEREASSLADQISDIEKMRAVALNRAGLESYLGAVQIASKDLASLDIRIAKAREFLGQQRQFEALLQKLESARADVKELRPGGTPSDAAGVDAARSTYQALIRKWLGILDSTVPNPIVGDNFAINIGPDTFTKKSPHSGSTRTRIVLALHAALLEASLSVGGCHPRVLLLDAPRQQEIAEKDLIAFVEGLRALRDEYRTQVQVVLAVVDFGITLGATDIEWAPTCIVDGKPRYLGPVAQL